MDIYLCLEINKKNLSFMSDTGTNVVRKRFFGGGHPHVYVSEIFL